MLRALTRSRHAVLPHLQRCSPDQRRHLLTLAIETSCDDTCVAILEKHDGAKIAEEGLKTQAKLHFHEKITAANTGKGGIHPLEALDHHRENLARLVQKSLYALPPASSTTAEAARIISTDGISRSKPDFVSVTRGPGMRSNLSCGLDTAKGLAAAWSIPMLGVHHMQAHALTPRLVHALSHTSAASPAFPFLNLLISGGHTMLLHSHSLTSHSTLATTLDTAIGDCLDKCGRTILPPSILATTTDTSYGKHLSSYAFPDPSTFTTYPIPLTRADETVPVPTPYNWTLTPPLAHTRQLAFSFAGIPSHADRILSANPNLLNAERLALARTALGASFTHLASRICLALSHITKTSDAPPISTLVVSGGVAANAFLRYFLRETLNARGYEHVELVFPPVELCTDNAAMIAWAGMEMWEAGYRTGLGVKAVRKWSMDEEVDGGILGVGGWERLGQ